MARTKLEHISVDEVDRKLTALSRQKGRSNAERFLSLLGKDREFMDAIETPVGQAVMTLLSDKMENKVAEIIAMKGNACPECPLLMAKIELQSAFEMINQVKNRINKYKERDREYKNL